MYIVWKRRPTKKRVKRFCNWNRLKIIIEWIAVQPSTLSVRTTHPTVNSNKEKGININFQIIFFSIYFYSVNIWCLNTSVFLHHKFIAFSYKLGVVVNVNSVRLINFISSCAKTKQQYIEKTEKFSIVFTPFSFIRSW